MIKKFSERITESEKSVSRMIKFILLASAAAVLCLSLFGCSGKNQETEETEKPSENSGEQKLIELDGYYFPPADDKSMIDEKSCIRFADKLNTINQTYLQNCENVFYTVIPDRAHYTGNKKVDNLDFDRMTDILNTNIKDMEYIDITGELSLESYYKTDIHWRQEKIFPAVNKIGEKLGFQIDENDFETKSHENFKGLYGSDSPDGETLYYLESENITNSSADNFQNPDSDVIYDTSKLDTDNPYDMFLQGPTPLITITNDSAPDRTLIVFRDSFASSMVPLLCGQYSKIVIIDIRYVMSSMLGDYVDFDGADVLFIYNTAVINRSLMLK